MKKDRFTEQRRKEREEAKDNRNEAYIEEIKLRRDDGKTANNICK